jgi:hypothetical protein
MEPDGVLFQRASRQPHRKMHKDAVEFLKALLLTGPLLDPAAPQLAFVSNYGHNCTRQGQAGTSFGINKARAAMDGAVKQLASELGVATDALRQRLVVLISFRKPRDSDPRLPEEAMGDFANSAEWTEAWAKPNVGMLWEAMRQSQCIDAAGFAGECLMIGAHDSCLEAARSAEIDYLQGAQGALTRLFQSPNPASLIMSGLSSSVFQLAMSLFCALPCVATPLSVTGRQKGLGGNDIAVAQLVALGFSEEASREVCTCVALVRGSAQCRRSQALMLTGFNVAEAHMNLQPSAWC